MKNRLLFSETLQCIMQLTSSALHSYVTTKSRSISPRGTKTYGESSDSEGAGDTFHPRTQNANDSGSTSSDQGYSPRASKKPSSARSVGKRDRVMKRVVSANEIDSLRATAEASLSQKVLSQTDYLTIKNALNIQSYVFIRQR